MHTLVECLPVAAGLFIALFYRLTKPFSNKNTWSLVLAFVFGLIANRLNGEGLTFLYVDVLMACGSAFVFLSLSKQLFKRWAS